MLKALKRARDNFFGYGEASVAIPVFDGSLKANNLLETAPVFFERAGLEDIACGPDGTLYAACENRVLVLDDRGSAEVMHELDAPIQALRPHAGGLAVATPEGVKVLGGTDHGAALSAIAGSRLRCVNALASDHDGRLLISQGSQHTDHAEWTRDLLSRNASGRVIAFDTHTGEAEVLASGLGYCFGVTAGPDQVIASESWRHRLHSINGAEPGSVTSELPGYPGRLTPATGGGYWLSVFAARSQLLEFVLREKDYREEMMRTIEPRYWIAPAFSSGADFREPLQIGGVRQMGILKPWAPPRSYGLVVRLGDDLRARYSLHSRVGGHHHGIVATAEKDGDLFIVSKGARRILRLAIEDLNQQEYSNDSDS